MCIISDERVSIAKTPVKKGRIHSVFARIAGRENESIIAFLTKPALSDDYLPVAIWSTVSTYATPFVSVKKRDRKRKRSQITYDW